MLDQTRNEVFTTSDPVILEAIRDALISKRAWLYTHIERVSEGTSSTVIYEDKKWQNILEDCRVQLTKIEGVEDSLRKITVLLKENE